MQFKEIVKGIIDADVPDFSLVRSFNEHPFASTAIFQANGAVADDPYLQDVVTAFAIAPAINWMLGGRKIGVVMDSADEAAINNLMYTQKYIGELYGGQPRLFLERREKYFKSCEELDAVLRSSIETIGHYPEKGRVYKALLNIFYDIKSDYQTKYYIRNDLNTALTIVKEGFGDKISQHLDVVLDGSIPTDSEMAYLHHNVSQLIAEYNRILWRAQHSDDKAMQLLNCKTTKQMEAITKSDSTYRQAYLLVEYIRFIGGAIEMVKTFPNGGEDYYRIITGIQKAKASRGCERDVAADLEMSMTQYLTKRTRAYTALGAILWGCDAGAFLTMLTERR